MRKNRIASRCCSLMRAYWRMRGVALERAVTLSILHPRARRLDRSEADLLEERHEAGIVVERGEHGLESGVLQSGVAFLLVQALEHRHRGVGLPHHDEHPRL